MRHARPAFSALTDQVCWAVTWAALFSLGAGILALALPFLVMHAIEAAERRQSFDGFLLVAGFSLAAAFMRSALMAARDRILLQAALWLDHTAGTAVLTDRLDRGVMPDTLDADRAALDRCVQAISGSSVGALIDALVAVAPLGLLFLIHPALGAVSLLVACGLVASGMARAKACAHALDKAGSSRANADKAWRTAAANGPMIAARRMSAGIVADWETLSRTAVISAYGLAQPDRRIAAVLRVIDFASGVLLTIVGIWLVQSDSVTLAAFAAAVVLHVMLTRAVLAAHDRLPDLAGLEAGWQHLAAPTHAMADRPAPLAPQVTEPPVLAAPMNPAPTAPLSPMPPAPMPTTNRAPAHPARPSFEPAAPLPTARPPATYGSSGTHRGHA